MTPRLTESDVEEAALAWLQGLGWGVAHGPDIAPDAPGVARAGIPAMRGPQGGHPGSAATVRPAAAMRSRS